MKSFGCHATNFEYISAISAKFSSNAESRNCKAEIGFLQYFAQKSISIEKDQLLVKLTRKEVSGEGFFENEIEGKFFQLRMMIES